MKPIRINWPYLLIPLSIKNKASGVGKVSQKAIIFLFHETSPTPIFTRLKLVVNRSPTILV
jgi:hypothetical protein